MNELQPHESVEIELSGATYSADRNPALVYLAGLAPSSRRPQAQSLNAIAATLGDQKVLLDGGKEITYQFVKWGALRYQHTQAIRAQLAEGYGATTANRHLSALRGVLKEAWRLGYMTAEDYQKAIDLKRVAGQSTSQAESGRHLSEGELKGLMGACNDGTLAGIRDAAIIAVGYGCGLRRSEIAKLDLADYDVEQASLRIRAGKGNKDRVVYLPEGAAAALDTWLQERGNTDGPLFRSIRKGGHMEDKGITDQAIYIILASRAQAGQVRSFTPHDLRRTFAGDMLDAGEDLSTVQKIMGHSSASTTAGYDRRGAKAKKRAASRLHVPYSNTPNR